MDAAFFLRVWAFLGGGGGGSANFIFMGVGNFSDGPKDQSGHIKVVLSLVSSLPTN